MRAFLWMLSVIPLALHWLTPIDLIRPCPALWSDLLSDMDSQQPADLQPLAEYMDRLNWGQCLAQHTGLLLQRMGRPETNQTRYF